MTPEFVQWVKDNRFLLRNDEVRKDVPWDEHKLVGSLVYTVEENYTVEFSTHEHIILRASAKWGTPSSRFQHDKMVACQTTVLEFKHYHPSGRKSWTAHPGIEWRWVIPKAKLELIPEKGYSYVPVKVNGVSFRLNVSGGTAIHGKGWTDWVRESADTCCGFKLAQLKALFDVGLTVEECKAAGIVVDLKVDRPTRFTSLAASKQTLQPGNVVYLDGCSFQGSQGPFTVERKYKQSYILNVFGMHGKCNPKWIDWTRTAEANSFALPPPIAWTKLGKIMKAAI